MADSSKDNIYNENKLLLIEPKGKPPVKIESGRESMTKDNLITITYSKLHFN